MPPKGSAAGNIPIGHSRGHIDDGEGSYEEQWHKERRERQRMVDQLRRRSWATGLDQFLSEAAVVAAEELRAELAQILEHDPIARRFRVRAGVGWRDSANREMLSASDGAQMGCAYSLGSTVVVERLELAPAFRGPGLLRDHGVVSGASVVIVGQEYPFGVLSVYSTRRRMFTPDDVEFLQGVASVISAATYRWDSHRGSHWRNGR
jgi:GAF domain-containing protein